MRMYRKLKYSLSLLVILLLSVENALFSCSAQSFTQRTFPLAAHKAQATSNQILKKLPPNVFVDPSTSQPDGRHQDEPGRLSPQSVKGQFDSVAITEDSLRFILSKPAGSFTEPLSATINGLAFPSIELTKKGRKLFLEGEPGGKPIGSIFPDGGK